MSVGLHSAGQIGAMYDVFSLLTKIKVGHNLLILFYAGTPLTKSRTRYTFKNIRMFF